MFILIVALIALIVYNLSSELLIKYSIVIMRPSVKLPQLLEDRRPDQSPEIDHSTLSNYKAFRVKHTQLDLKLSFDQKLVEGTVTFLLERAVPAVEVIDLDTSYLTVESVTVNGELTPFQIAKRVEPLGSRFTVNISKHSQSTELEVAIRFATTAKCTALQWLDSQQTSGKPYVFSQLEAIHARSLFPCFDTPSVKSPFSANIESILPVVFSGINSGKEGNVYKFVQKIPIPAYLVGIASGDLVDAPIGPRSKVYTEPFRLQDAQWEFNGEVESFIQAAEKIIFDYEWGTYDVLINVDSYPYGGMESPNMTFATPTLIAHDKSNIDVIAHELAHSWSGNLVTNCSWNHFWLNEGWTVYLERRITGAIHGEPTRHFSAIIGWNDLQNSITTMRNPDRFSTLVQNLGDSTDPDEAFSTVPYEKGFNLLFHLENRLGGIESFDPFIKYYFRKFATKSLDTFEFLDTLYEFYNDKREILDSIDWETWLFKPGMPPKPEFDTSLADAAYNLSNSWVKAASSGLPSEKLHSQFSAGDVEGFNSNQVVLFLETLTQASSSYHFSWDEHSKAASELLDIYSAKIGSSKNAEVVFMVYKFAITARIQEYYSKLAEWLGTVGRMKFVRPGYRLLNEVDRKLALETFSRWKNTYHPICKALVKQDLEL